MSYKLSPLCLVVLFSLGLGLLQGGAGPIGWQDAIEHGAVLSGQVSYPANHPIGLYYSKAYSFCNHLAALWIKAGLSEQALAGLCQVLKAMVLYTGLALATFALTSRASWSIMAPLIWYAFPIWSFTESYPITPISHPNTNGFLGLTGILLAFGLLANRRHLLGGIALGILPYVHLALGAFGWACGGLWWLATGRKRREAVGFGIGALISAVSYLCHQRLFLRGSGVTGGLADYYYYFYTLIFDYHRQPLSVTTVHSFVILVVGILAVFYLVLRRSLKRPGHGDVIPWSMIAAVAAAVIYSVIGSLWGLTVIPKVLIMLMPGRLANVALVLSGALLFGLAALLPPARARFFATVLTLSAFVPLVVNRFALAQYGWDLPVTILVCFLAMALALLLMPYRHANGGAQDGNGAGSTSYLSGPAGYSSRIASALLIIWVAFRGVGVFSPTLWFGAKVSLQNQHLAGLIVLVALLLGIAFLLPLDRGVVTSPNSRPGWPGWITPTFAGCLICALNIGLISDHGFASVRFFDATGVRPLQRVHLPAGQVIPAPSEYALNELQGRHPVLWFFDARTGLPYAPEAGPAMEMLLRDIYGWHQLYDPAGWGFTIKSKWESFSPEVWRGLADKYACRSIAVPMETRLDLPLIQQAAGYSFYRLPGSASVGAMNDIPAFNDIDTKSSRSFFLPRTRWFPHGWYPLEVDSTLTATWSWLEKRGQIGVYVSETGDYYLHTYVAPVGDQRLTIRVRGGQAKSTYLLSDREFPAFSEFTSDALHLSSGFNLVDIKADGPVKDVGGNRNGSIGFKNVQWQNAEEHSRFLRGGAVILPQTISGDWKSQGRAANISVTDAGIICRNEAGATSKAEIENERMLRATDWNVRARLSEDGKELRWSNGTVWQR